MNDEPRKCLYCGEPIYGRSDKKFCSDYCRNAYNNQRYRETTAYIRKINAKLKKNWKILKELNPSGKTKVRKDQLTAEGFDFQYFTSIYRTKKNDIYYYVYDQGYLPLNNDYYILVQKFEKKDNRHKE
ncbi:MAG: DUF2116 family Zn-ribbon domain-containing protein [Chlorobi bacterium]|nr:DUF2116 family Zn-ribbon domain-containing protein [Chlorobiota bacterium]